MTMRVNNLIATQWLWLMINNWLVKQALDFYMGDWTTWNGGTICIYGAFFGLGKGVFDAEYHGIYIYIPSGYD